MQVTIILMPVPSPPSQAAMEVASSQDLDKVDSPFAGISDGSGTLFQSSVEAVQSQPVSSRCWGAAGI